MIRAAAVLLTLLGATAAPAAAEPPPHDHVEGGCRVYARSLDATHYEGVLYATAAAWALWHERDPLTMTGLSCELAVNGVPVVTAEGATAGPAGYVEPRPVAYTATDTDVVTVCLTAHLVDAHGDPSTVVDCGYRTTELRLVPHPVDEALEHGGRAVVDAAACAAFLALGPYAPPPLTVGPDGDVHLSGEPWWDCPPYGG